MLARALLMLLLTASPSERPTVVTKLPPPARLTVGDRFELALTVTTPEGSLVTGPLPDSMGVFAVADEKRKTAIRAGHAHTTYRLSLAGFKPGRHPLPVFNFVVRTGAQADTLRSDTGSVSIASVLPATMQDIHPLAPPETFPNLLLWLIPGLIVLAALLAYLGMRLVRRLRRLQQEALALPSPWEEALQALDATPWRDWLEEGQFKRYYYSLSQILKRYIERRFEFRAVEQTTTELLASMRAHKTPMRDEVARFLARSDLVKYAKSVPPADEAGSALAQVREFVLKTKPLEPAPDAPAVPAGAAPAAAQGSA
jgi:hypothetical protein